MNIEGLGPANKPALCLCVKPKTDITSELKYVDLLEYRVDLAPKIKIEFLTEELELLRSHGKPMILTNRRAKEGGAYAGSEQQRINLMKSLLDYADIIDIELDTRDGLRDELLDEAQRKKIKSIISYHDFNETPSQSWIMSIIEKEHNLGDIAKAAFKVNSPGDILTIYHACFGFPDKPVIAIPMGSPLARMAGILFNVPVLYCGNIAPGQLTAEQTRHILDLHYK